MERLDRLLEEMVIYNAGDPKRIQHLVKVHAVSYTHLRSHCVDDGSCLC